MKKLLVGLFFILFASPFAFAIDPISAINKANPAIMQWRIVGSCNMYSSIVEHWIPLAWIETSPSGSSLIDGVSTQDGKSSLLREAGLESSVSTRILDFNDSLWMNSALAMSHGQQVCSVEDAYAGGGSELPSTSAGCSDSGSIKAAMRSIDGILQSSLNGLMTVAYDSTKDSGWLSGCRDKDKVDAAVAAQVRCTTDMLGADMQPGGANAQVLASKNCLGKWGSLYPRQARDIGFTGPVSSAKAAYRAMSTARAHLGRIYYPIDKQGQMQQAFPSISSGFRAGDMPLPGATQSTNRTYGWIYWRKVSCCI